MIYFVPVLGFIFATLRLRRAEARVRARGTRAYTEAPEVFAELFAAQSSQFTAFLVTAISALLAALLLAVGVALS